MSDGSIHVNISPTSGKRLAESSSSFASDKLGGTQQRFAQPGTGQRSEINVEKKLVDVQTALVAEIRELRKTMRGTAAGSSERATMQSRINDLFVQQKRGLAGALNAGTVAKERMPTSLTTRSGVAMMPSGRILARSLFGVASETFAGNPVGAFRHAVSGASALGAGRYLASGGAAEGIAEGAAAEGAEAAGGSIIGSVLGVGGTAAALGVAGYEAYKHPDIVKGIVSSPLAIFDARRYGNAEATRQTGAYRYAREFGEAGAPLSSFTRSSRFSALGMDAQQALDVVGGMRETAGASNLSDVQAYRATKMGTDIGLSNADITAIGGQAGKLGIDPERMIDIIAKGTERGGQKGLQGEVGRATLDYLRQQSQLGAVDEKKAAETVTGMAAILGASGIAAFRGAGAITNGIAGISAANQPGDLFGTQSTGAAYTTIGQTRVLESINRDRRFKRMSALDKLGLADRVLTQGFTGPNAGMYLKSVIAPEIEQAKAQGLYGLESLETQYGFPVGSDTDKLLTGSLLTAAQAGDVSAYLKLKSQLEANGPGNIPAATVAMASHAMAGSAAGASSMRTFTGVENVEASMLRRLAIAPSTDKDVSRLLNKFASSISPSSAATPTSEMGATMGDDARIANADLSRLDFPPMLRAEMGGAPSTATSAASDDSARDSTLQSVGAEIVVAINTLITAIANGGSYSLPPASLPSPTAAVAGHGPVAPTGSY